MYLHRVITSETTEDTINKTTHTHPFNGPLSGTTWVSRYQKGKTNLDFTEARDGEWQWNPLGHMQVCTSLQTNNHANKTMRYEIQLNIVTVISHVKLQGLQQEGCAM